MSLRRWWMVAPASLLLAGLASCASNPVKSVLNPVVAQLERFQSAAAAKRWEEIAAEPVTARCEPGKDGCARLHALRADACFTLAMQPRAPGTVCPSATDEARQRLACAAESYRQSRSVADASVDVTARAVNRFNLTQALYCSAELAESLESGLELARQANAEALGLDPPERELRQGLAQLYLARPGAGSDVERCSAAQRALAFADRALTGTPDAGQRQQLDRLARDAAARRGSISGCGG